MTSVSGIDTDSIVTQMLAVERRPQDMMKAKVAAMTRAQNAWQAIADKLVAVKTATDALSSIGAAAKLRTVTSSNPSAVGVRTIGGGANASSTVEVTSLAAAHSVLASDTFSAATDSVGARTLTLTTSTGTTATVSSTDGTLSGLATAVNNANLGMSAKVLQTSPGVYQLSITANATGAAGAFSATGTGWTSISTVRQGANAQFTVDGVSVQRASNVVSDVLDGVELTLQAVTTSAVSVTTSRDDSAISDKVKAMVTAINDLGGVVKSATKNGKTEAERGPLVGEFQARQLMDRIRSVIASPITTADGTSITAAELGVTLQRDGTVKFDQEKLSASLRDKPDAVLAALGRTGTSSAAGVSVAGLTNAAVPSNRSITVTQAAAQATLVGQIVPPPPAGTQVTLNIVTPTGSYNVSFVAGASFAETGANLNAALRAAGVKMVAVSQGDHLELKDERFGTGNVFTVSGGTDIGLDGTATDGANAAGTIDGTAFTAVGKTITSNGYVLSIGTTDAQLAAAGGTVTGNVVGALGLSGALGVIGAQGTSTGSVLASKATLQDQIDDLQKRIDDFNDILSQRELVLRRRFAAMEELLSRLQGQTSSFASVANNSGG